MPLAIEQLDLSGYDLIVSSSHAVAKGVLTGPDQVHISYVHSPMRYAWDLQHQYLRQAKLERGLKSHYVRWLLSRLRQWDVRTAPGVNIFVANSEYIARRIKKAYGREAEVIPPPVDTTAFELCTNKSNFYFVVSRQVPYKRIDLIAAAFAQMPHRKLIIVGDGPEHQNVVDAAEGAANIEIRGAVSHEALCELMQHAQALVVAAEEDFGITMVEAQACGTPVISFARGGARDIIVTTGPTPTGVLFDEQTPDAIIKAVEAFEALRPNILPVACRNNALRFTVENFRARFGALVEQTMLREHLDKTGDQNADERRSLAVAL
jgi:glycosyltransferase involved in cell wall biosynthesis